MKPHFALRTRMLTTAVAGLLTQLPLLAAPIELATCTSADSLKSWTSVNDGVMGGISTGGFKRTEQGTLLFSGELSLENNGGFASLRSPALRQDLAGLEAFVLRVRGDGRRYKFTVRTESGFDTPIYCGVLGMEYTMALTRPAGTLSHRMGEGRGEGTL